VDARDATKQNTLSSASGGNVVLDANNNTGNVITNITATDGVITISKGNIASTDYVTNGDNALSMTDSTTKAPTIHAVQGMKTTSVRAVSSAVDTLVPTEKAVASAISTASSGITGEFEEVGDLENDPNAATEAHNVVVDADDPTKIPRNYNIQKGIMYLNGTGIENHSATALTGDDVAAGDSWTEDSSETAVYKIGNMDDYVPTMAAVEARVKKAQNDAVSEAGSAAVHYTDNVLTSTARSNTNKVKLPEMQALQTSTTTAASTAPTSTTGRWQTTDSTATATYASDEKWPTQKAVTQQIEALDLTAVSTTGKPIVSVSQTDGLVSASVGEIKNAGIASDAAIDFSKMSDVLKDVNSASTDATCSAGSPCVLTFYKVGNTKYYKWTNMDTESTNAVPNS